jgi:hypothetical protein
MGAEVAFVSIVGSIGSFVTFIAVIWLIVRATQRRAQLRADVQMKLIDKFGTSAEFVQFLESPAGREFLRQQRNGPRDRVLSGIRAGVVLTFLGLAFTMMIFVFHETGFSVPAFLLLALGLGFFVSSALSVKLAKRWSDNGLTQPE